MENRVRDQKKKGIVPLETDGDRPLFESAGVEASTGHCAGYNKLGKRLTVFPMEAYDGRSHSAAIPGRDRHETLA